MRRLLATHLSERGYDVRCAGSAEAALTEHEKEPFDLMLIDWTLPGMSGLDLCRLVRSREGGEDIVILVITGRSQPADLHAVLDAGASDYVSKPVDPDVLRTRLIVASRQANAMHKRRQGQKALERVEKSFHRIVEAAPDAILISRHRKVIYGNPRLVRFLQYDSIGQIIGKPLRHFLHPEEPLSTLESQDGSETMIQEVRFRPKTGTTEIVGEAIAVRVVFRGETSLLVMIRDVSERKEMQTRLLRADRMLSMGTLAAGIAHEINNPLAYVLNNLRLSREEIEQELTNDRQQLIRQQLDEAGQGARRIRDILRDLQTLVREDQTRKSKSDVNEVMASCIRMCSNEIRHRAQLKNELDDAIPPVAIDESRLGQIFLNLLVNAAQSMDEGSVHQNVIELSSTVEENFVVVRIRDTGKGIEPTHLDKIFEPFFTTKTGETSSGLGLAICRNLISKTGGQLHVESQIDVGTTFTMKLPKASPSKMQEAKNLPAQTESTNVRAANVLVIDDEELVGRSIRRALRKHDVQVVTSGKDAIRLLCATPNPKIDIVFCDVMMPELSGIEVFETVNKQIPSIAQRFVFMTGGAFTPRARRFLESVSNTCLEKPFDLHEIRRLTNSALS